MKQGSRIVIGLLCIITMLLGVVVGMMLDEQKAVAGGGAGAGSLLAVTQQFSESQELLYLIDTSAGVMAAYRIKSSGSPRIELVSARMFTYDTKLPDYNTQGISVKDVKKQYDKYMKSQE